MSTPTKNPTAALLLIGNELLSGKVHDQNGYETAKLFYKHGIQLLELRAILDVKQTIVDTVRELSSKYDYLITSGGLGPTHDDITMQAIAEALDDKIVIFDEMLDKLKAGYGKRYTDAVAKMAMLPSKAKLVYGRKIDWPLIQAANIVILPGVPELFKYKLEAFCDTIDAQAMYLTELYLNAGEAQFAEYLNELDGLHADVDIGSYPVWNNPSYKVKITFEGLEQSRVEDVCEKFREAFAEYVVTDFDKV